MTSSDKLYNTKLDEDIETKSFVIFGANGNWIIDKVMKEMGWKQLAGKLNQNFHLKWVESRLSVNYDNFREGEQMVNRIPNCYMLTNKLGLLVNLHRFHLRCTSEHVPEAPNLKISEFLPETYRIDDQKDREFFEKRFRQGEIWISKPIGLNQGRGIHLVRDVEECTCFEGDSKGSRLIQRYINNPMLIEGRKFDIRVYMLISSTKPFLVLFRNGYLRLSLHKYDETSEDLTVHLTNQFIQRRSSLYETCKNETILSFEKFNDYINEHVKPHKNIEHDWVLKSLTSQMKNISLFAFLGVKDKLKSKVGYFDLYGIDFLVDENLKVWLLEVNVNPCLATNCQHLKQLIPSVINETLNVSVECFNKSWDKLPLLPCNSLRAFEVLYYDCLGGFDYSKNPLSYSLRRSATLTSIEGRPQSPRKKNIISVVFDLNQEDQNSTKVPHKSMFDVGLSSSQYNVREYTAKNAAANVSSGPEDSFNPFEKKDNHGRNSILKEQRKDFEFYKETTDFTPSFGSSVQPKTSKFVIKGDNSRFETDFKKKVSQKLSQLKKSSKKAQMEHMHEPAKNMKKSMSSIFCEHTDETPGGQLASLVSSSQDVTENFGDVKAKKDKKHSSQVRKLHPSYTQEYAAQQKLQQDHFFDDNRPGSHRKVQQAVSNSSQLPPSVRTLLKSTAVDDKQSMSTMKILKTLRPAATSSIKPDYIATNKLLLQTMSKMNAERKIKNLQDTYYNQSITQYNF